MTAAAASGSAQSPAGVDATEPRWLRSAVGGLLALLAGLFAFRRVETADLFWHLAAGADILATGRVPRTDRWAALTHGQPWLDIHWLAQIAMSLVERLGGLVALQGWTVATSVLALAVALIAGRAGGAIRWPVALLALVAASQRLEPRPDLVSLVVPVLFVLLLDRIGDPVAAHRSPLKPLATLALLQVLWTNVHGSFILGPVMVAVYAAAALLARPRGFRIDRLSGALVLTAAATLINPRGWIVWQLFRPYIDAVAGRLGYAMDGPPAPRIQEWLPPLTPDAAPYLRGVLGPYVALLIVAVVAVVASGRRPHLPRAALLLLFGAMSLTALRHIAPFAFVALAIVPPLAAVPLERLAVRARAALSMGLALATLVGACWLLTRVASNRYYTDLTLPTEIGPGIHPTAFPAGACDWLAGAAITGQAFHNYELGGYYLWRFDRLRTPLIDGRADLLAPGQLARYTRAVTSPPLFEGLAAELGVTHVLLKYATADSIYLFPYLEGARTSWTRVFADGSGAVYLRRTAATQEAPPAVPVARPTHPVDRLAARLFAPFERHQTHLPAATMNLAMLHEAAGEPAAAAAWYEAAVAQLPALPGVHARLVMLYSLLGEPAKAEPHEAWLEAHAPRGSGSEWW